MWWFGIPFASFFAMMVYAGIMGREGLEEHPIGDPTLLVEEWLIIMFLMYFVLICKKIYNKINNRFDETD